MPLSLDWVRESVAAFPKVEERRSHGMPTWFYRGKKAFAVYAESHHGARIALWLAAPEGVQQTLVESAPDQYFYPPYVGVRGWIGAFLDGEIDHATLEGLIGQAYACISHSGNRKLQSGS